MRNNGNDHLIVKYGYGKKYKDEKIRSNIWMYATGVDPDRELTKKHPAVFPEQLAADHIFSWSNPGDVVYDPFAGSFTVPKMCVIHGRNYIGSEISKEYCEIGEQRLKVVLSGYSVRESDIV
jgi:site-specific DNA-methyltransferase (adenine-specific)